MDITCSQHSTATPSIIRLLIFMVVMPLGFELKADQNKSFEQNAALAALHNEALASACHNEFAQYCGADSDTPACRNRLVDALAQSAQSNLLGTCCTAKLHELGFAGGKFKVNHFSGVTFNEGAELQYDYFCETATLVSEESTKYQNLEVQGGPMVFGALGNLKLARLQGLQVIHDLQLSDEQPLTQFFDTNVPKLVRLKDVSVQFGIPFQPMENSKLNDMDKWSATPTDLLYQLADHTVNGKSNLATALHSNGRVARGNIAEPVVVNGLPMAPGVTELDDQGRVISGKLSIAHLHNGLLLGAGQISFGKNGELIKGNVAAGAKLNGWEIDTPSELSVIHGKNKSIILGKTESGINHYVPVQLGSFRLTPGLRVQLYENYQVQSLRVTEDSWYRGTAYPSQTEIKFSEQGDVIWDSFYDERLPMAAQNANLRDSLPEILPTAEVRGGHLLPKASLIYSTGRFGEQRIVVPNVFHFNGFSIAAGEFRVDRNLKLREARLANKIKYHGAMLKPYPAKVSFDEDGAIAGAYLLSDTFMDGIQYAKDGFVEFTPGGKVLKGRLASVASIDGRRYQANTVLHLDENGQVEQGVLAEDLKIGSVFIPVGSEIRFQAGQRLKISSAHSIKVDGIEYSGRSLVMMEDGTVQTGKLINDSIINDEFFEAGTVLMFRANGDVAYYMPASPMDNLNLRPVSGPVFIPEPAAAEAFPSMSPQACQLYIERMKRKRGFQISGGYGFSVGNGNFVQDCIDSTFFPKPY